MNEEERRGGGRARKLALKKLILSSGFLKNLFSSRHAAQPQT
jgi:hypothetical protein